MWPLCGPIALLILQGLLSREEVYSTIGMQFLKPLNSCLVWVIGVKDVCEEALRAVRV